MSDRVWKATAVILLCCVLIGMTGIVGYVMYRMHTDNTQLTNDNAALVKKNEQLKMNMSSVIVNTAKTTQELRLQINQTDEKYNSVIQDVTETNRATISQLVDRLNNLTELVNNQALYMREVNKTENTTVPAEDVSSKFPKLEYDVLEARNSRMYCLGYEWVNVSERQRFTGKYVSGSVLHQGIMLCESGFEKVLNGDDIVEIRGYNVSSKTTTAAVLYNTTMFKEIKWTN